MRLPSFIKLPTYRRYKYVPRYADTSERAFSRPRFSWAKRSAGRRSGGTAGMRLWIMGLLMGLFLGYFYLGSSVLWVIVALLFFRIAWRVLRMRGRILSKRRREERLPDGNELGDE